MPAVEILLSSPYARAWCTAEILDEETDWPSPRSFPSLEPDGPVREVADTLSTYSNVETLAGVGHSPSLNELAAYPLNGSEDGLNIGLKKGGAACIRIRDGKEPGEGKLRWLLTPKILGAVGGA
ncbi:hypothetical protein BH23ACT11_BH23ACT11_00250 [soil metagenome]